MSLLLNRISMYNGSHYTKMKQSHSAFPPNVNNNDDNCAGCECPEELKEHFCADNVSHHLNKTLIQ